MENTKIVKAYCPRSHKYFGLEVKQINGVWKIVNMVDLSEKEARAICSEVKQPSFETNDTLIPCSDCGSRKVAGCSCARKKHQCSRRMKYQFDCIYCDELQIDYSLPGGSFGRKGETVTLSQGKEVKVVTFSNVTWKKFDNVLFHEDGSHFKKEPRVHVKASKENIEFHGYNVSRMDEGVYYTIGKDDDFEIECDVDTSSIQPHPGGYFYVAFGIISAKIGKTGGDFFLDGKKVATVGSGFSMRLSLTDGGRYCVFIDGQKVGEMYVPVKEDTKITFGFAHDSHNCELLSHAYVRGIRMWQGVSNKNQ